MLDLNVQLLIVEVTSALGGLLDSSPAANWPSLFIGPKGTRSGLHIDSQATHFWMLLVEGSGPVMRLQSGMLIIQLQVAKSGRFILRMRRRYFTRITSVIPQHLLCMASRRSHSKHG